MDLNQRNFMIINSHSEVNLYRWLAYCAVHAVWVLMSLRQKQKTS